MAMRALLLLCCLLPGASVVAQEPDPAEAYGIYRPEPSAEPEPAAAEVSADTAGRETAGRAGAGDTAARDTAARRPASGITDVAAALAADTARSLDSAAAPSDTARGPVVLERVEEVADDTSLTARMDLSRGGGLRRQEFPDLRESARFTGRYDVFLELISSTSVATALADTAPLTVLAPTDSAFASLPPDVLEQLRGDSATVERWAASLLVPGDRSAADLLGAGTVVTLAGTALAVQRDGGATTVGGEARLVQADLLARNGRVHGVDRVILPEADTATSAVP
jgi:uncharacterized surface protein with fasciclin (FAS1) repeats